MTLTYYCPECEYACFHDGQYDETVITGRHENYLPNGYQFDCQACTCVFTVQYIAPEVYIDRHGFKIGNE